MKYLNYHFFYRDAAAAEFLSGAAIHTELLPNAAPAADRRLFYNFFL
jgi:hypothetical protein